MPIVKDGQIQNFDGRRVFKDIAKCLRTKRVPGWAMALAPNGSAEDAFTELILQTSERIVKEHDKLVRQREELIEEPSLL
jgi:hypothetical protein